MSQRRMKITDAGPFFILFLTFFSFSSKISIAAQNTITSSTPLSGNDTVVSPSSTFELGFFVRGNSTYLGIWYKKISIHTVVWVANRDTPLAKSTGILKIDGGNLILSDGTTVVWSSNVSKTAVGQPVAKLLDSGNFVLSEGGDANSDSFLWQSFDYPSDTLLPGMKLGWNLTAGLNRFLTSWKNDDNPSSGDYTFKMDANGSAELILSFQLQPQYRSGPWNGLRFSGVPEMTPNDVISGIDFVSTPDAVYYTFDYLGNSLLSRLVLNNTGQLQSYTWAEQGSGGGLWSVFWWAPKDQCDHYSECGPYGVCAANGSPVCDCVEGFSPKSPDDWYQRVTSGGCIRKAKLECGGDGFLKLPGMKLPDSSKAVANISMSLEDCRIECLKSCSCVAYASADIRGGGSGCIRWASDLIDLREHSDVGQDLYIRVPASQLGKNNRINVIKAIIGASSAVGVILLVCIVIFLSKFVKRTHVSNNKVEAFLKGYGSLASKRFRYSELKKMTNSFKDKLGEGGYGGVFKGKLKDGCLVAVKVLNNSKGNGEDFINEVTSIGRTSHVNIVTLLGFCYDGSKRALIYEFMSNGSLEKFIYSNKSEGTKRILDWERLFEIAVGIARGLEYLHRGCSTRILHFDIKPHNILLDDAFCPKISDFGLAKLCPKQESIISMQDARGTAGYIAPEVYSRNFGRVSPKSDVYSYGMMVLEMVGGRKNIDARVENTSEVYFPHWIYNHIALENSSELIGIVEEEKKEIVRKMVLVGLWCIQTDPTNRPSMSKVVEMLEGSVKSLEMPPKPFLSSHQ